MSLDLSRERECVVFFSAGEVGFIGPKKSWSGWQNEIDQENMQPYLLNQRMGSHTIV